MKNREAIIFFFSANVSLRAFKSLDRAAQIYYTHRFGEYYENIYGFSGCLNKSSLW